MDMKPDPGKKSEAIIHAVLRGIHTMYSYFHYLSFDSWHLRLLHCKTIVRLLLDYRKTIVRLL